MTTTEQVMVGDAMITFPPVQASPTTVTNVIHDLLTICADAPGVAGRLRMARILTGSQTPADREAIKRIPPSTWTHDVTQADAVRIIDAMIKAGAVVQTPGIRPVLVMTRAGFTLLNTLDNEGDN